MAKVAVIGAGVAGISTAYHLRGKADVTLFERESVAGGHAHSVEVTDDSGVTHGMDMAFIVFNEPHYPRLTEFFADLGVATQDHPGKFSFWNADTGAGYVSDDLALAEEEIRAKYPEDFVKIAAEAARFYEESPKDFIRKRAEMPLGEYLDRNGYSHAFRYGFIVLIATAAWSVPAEKIWEMPAGTVIAFFLGHGKEGLGGRSVPWKTVTGGSINYVRTAVRKLREAGQSVRVGTEVLWVAEDAEGVTVQTPAGPERFDQVVLAGHADDALALLRNPAPQAKLLEAVHYNTTRAVLHTDPRCISADRDVWRSWNYARSGSDQDVRTWVIYYLNSLHGFTSGTDYFLTLDYPHDLDPASIIEDRLFRHPTITTEVRDMQPIIRSVNGSHSAVKFAGSYFHSRKMGVDIIGMHESAYDSGAAAADSVLDSLA